MNLAKTILVLLLFAVSASAQGLTVVMNETSGGQTAQRTLQVDRTHARLETGPGTMAIYDAQTKMLRMFAVATKTYTEMTPESVQQLLKALPPLPTPPPIAYKETGSSKVRNWACKTYDGTRGAAKVVEVCAGDSGTGLTAEDLRLVQDAATLVKGLVAPNMIERLPLYATVAAQGYAGFPVRRVFFKDGKPDVTIELVEIKRGAIPASTFEIPAGYTKPKTGQ